jgi:hypothetical protein
MGASFPGIVETFGWIIGNVVTAQQARPVIERELDVASQVDRADLKISRWDANDTASFRVASVNGLLHGFGIHGNTVTDGTISRDIEDLLLFHPVSASSQGLVITCEQMRCAESDECHQ